MGEGNAECGMRNAECGMQKAGCTICRGEKCLALAECGMREGWI